MTSTGFGVDGVSWTEINSWCQLVKRLLLPHEAVALKRMSDEYAHSFNEAKSPDCPPPFVSDDEIQKKKASDALKAILDSMVQNQKSQKKKK